MTLPSINFRSIREHNGSQNTGFEELTFHLIPWIDDLDGRDVVRHGNPDGGLEAHVEFEDGSVWGWQAKYFFQVGDSQLAQMKRSFTTALENHPTLVRYTFILPFNPPSGQPARGKSASQKLKEAFTHWESAAATSGCTVKICLVDESRLVNILTDEEHTGRVFYWFDQRLLFTKGWFENKLEAAVDEAGTRYTPEVNVELPVGFAFEGLGRTERFAERFTDTVAEVGRSARHLRPSKKDPGLTDDLKHDVQRVANEIEALVSELRETPIDGVTPLNWEARLTGISEVQQRLEPVSEKLFQRVTFLRDRDKGAEPTPSHQPWRTVENPWTRVLRVQDALSDLGSFLGDPAARLAAQPLLFLKGEAGTGKTHLLCDIALRRLSENRPTVLVLGQQLEAGNLRKLLPHQLDLPDLTMEQLLEALNTAGQVAGTRALLMIDAINEGGGLDTWPPHIRGIAAEVAKYPHVGLVVSCRSSYIPAVLAAEPDVSEPSDLGFVVVNHEGFAGHEWDAASRFFGHWNLTLPDFPLLTPEYTNPLFLKLLCKSLSEAGETTLPRGATGVTKLFERFLWESNRLLSGPSRCDFRQEDDLVSKAVGAVARTMLDSGSDRIPYAKFQHICEALLPDRAWGKSLARGLLDEGVVARDYVAHDEVVRLSYQRLGDHLQATELLATRDAEAIRAVLVSLESEPGGFYQRSGLLEALAVQLPEKRSLELHDLVNEPHHEVIQDAFLKSIIWRDPQCFPKGLSLDYLNAMSDRRLWSSDPVLDTILQVACVPDHPFNAELLHHTLARLPLPNRDSWWTTYINGSSREDSLAYRIIDWARSSQQEIAADDAARLAAIALAWFLSASNRDLRDRATKALVVLLRKRLSVLVDLLRRFESVDDPYVAERLYAVAYGCALSTKDMAELEELAGAVFDMVFADEKPPVHILLRDYARGVVEVAMDRGATPPHVNVDLVRPPYVSPWPIRIPTHKQIEGRAPVETHRGLHASLTSGIADFANYTVGSAVRDFEAPNQRRRRRQQREKAREETRRAAKDAEAAWEESVVAFSESLDDEQRELLSRSVGPSPPSDTPVMWTDDEASRWIFRRVLELGWTPERFGFYDEVVASHDRHARDGRTERIGKKYQWIAFHDLLARIADHCRYRPRLRDEPDPYDGPWQLYLRDIDPSITFEPVNEPFDQSPVTWWQPLSVKIRPFIDRAGRHEWSISDSDVPSASDLKKLIQVRDADGSAWLTLEGACRWEEDPPKHSDSESTDRAILWLQIRSYVIPRKAFREFTRWAKGQDWFGRWMPEGSSVSRAYFGEWPWHPSTVEFGNEQREIEGHQGQVGKAPTAVLPTWADYHWEGDGALPDGANATLPTAWIVNQQNLRWRQESFAFYRPDGEIVARDPTSHDVGPSALLFAEDSIRQLLDEQNSSIIWTILGEKNIYGDFRGKSRRRLVISGVGALESGAAELQLTRRTSLH